MLKRATARMALMGTWKLGLIWERLWEWEKRGEG